MTDHDLIDRRLDGDCTDAAWAAACSADPALDGALAAERARRAAIAALPRPALDPALRQRLLAAAPIPARTIAFPRWSARRITALAAAAVLAVLVVPLTLEPAAVDRTPILPLAELPAAPPATGGGALSAWTVSVRQGGQVTLTPAQAGPIGGLRIEALDAQGRVLLSIPARPTGVAPASIVTPDESWQIELGRVPGAASLRLRRSDEVGLPLPLP